MAKPELRDHRKFLKLRRLLGEPTPHVMGYLECLWLRGYQTGSAFIGDAADVEAAAEFPGELGRFADAAHQSGFLDLENGMYSIHDLYQHAPKYARMRMERRGTAPKRAPAIIPPVAPASPKKPKRGTRVTKRKASEHARDQDEHARDTDTRSEILDPKSENLEPRTESQEVKSLPASAGPPAETKPPVVETPKEAHPRHELFDALADVSGADKKLNGSQIGRLVTLLLAATPPYTPAEVRDFGVRFWELCPWAVEAGMNRPTLGTIENHLSTVRAPPVQRAPPGRFTKHPGHTDKDAERNRIIEEAERERQRRKS